MKSIILSLTLALISLPAAQAQDSLTYADGYNAGYKDGYEVGRSIVSNSVFSGGGGGGIFSGGGSQFDISSQILNLQNGVAGGGASLGESPDFLLVPAQSAGTANDALTGTAIPLYGKLDFSDPGARASVLNKASAATGLPADQLSIYAVPVAPLVENQTTVNGYQFDGTTPNSALKSLDFGNSSQTLQTFGNIKIDPGQNLNVIAAPN